MARINYSRFAARKGATLNCGKCRNEIGKGDQYRWFTVGFRSRYKHVRCMRPECSPRQSEMTNSKMSGVYAAIESAEDSLDALAAGDPEDDASSIESAVHDAAEGIEEVAEEYREANEASPTGMVFGEDLNERADELSDAASELESWDAEQGEPDFYECDDEMHDEDAKGPDGEDQEVIERGDTAQCESCREIKQAWWDEQIGAARSALSDVSL